MTVFERKKREEIVLNVKKNVVRNQSVGFLFHFRASGAHRRNTK